MAFVAVEVVNGSGQTVRLGMDDESDQLAYLKTLVKREEVKSVKVLPARKPAASK